MSSIYAFYNLFYPCRTSMSRMWQSESQAMSMAATARAPANAPKPIYFENDQDIAYVTQVILV